MCPLSMTAHLWLAYCYIYIFLYNVFICHCVDSCGWLWFVMQMFASASQDKMDHMLPGSMHSRRFRLVAAVILILLAVTCYFCWEILYQERVILNILRMSKTSSGSANEPKIPLGSDHLEEVVEAFFEQKKREVVILYVIFTSDTCMLFSMVSLIMGCTPYRQYIQYDGEQCMVSSICCQMLSLAPTDISLII